MDYPIRFSTSYSQFYLYDQGSPAATDSNEFWTDEAFESKLAIEDGILGVCIGTCSFVQAALVIRVSPSEQEDILLYDHVVEGSIEVRSGMLQLLSCPSSTVAWQVAVTSGTYRVRVYTSGLTSIVDESEVADDKYLIEVWPEPYSPRAVLKQYSGCY